jgi:periplasmic mercuric ion binding protein
MKSLVACVSAAVVLLAAPLLMAQESAPLTATISDMHLCCKGCTMAVEKAVAKVAGVKCTASKDDSNAVLTAENPKALQEAVDEIAAAGFYGTIDTEEAKFKPIEFKEGNVHKLEITNIHNCCQMCTDTIKGAIEGVAGVTSNNVKNKKVSFAVEGDFSPAEVVKAIQDAGFYPTVKGKEAKKE